MTMQISRYKPRYFRFHDDWNVEGLRLKFYSIATAPDAQPPQKAIDAALDYARAVLPVVRAEEGEDHGLGYAMLHMGEMSNWLLVHWWAHEDIALRLLASADTLENPRFVSRDHRRFHACTWEHVVIDHERDAWVRNAMGPHGDAQAYLADRLDDGAH